MTLPSRAIDAIKKRITGPSDGDVVECPNCHREVVVGLGFKVGRAVYCDETCADRHIDANIW